MAFSGSLNFLSSSGVGSHMGASRFYGSEAANELSRFIHNDFVGLNTNIYEPITSSNDNLDNFVFLNTLGHTEFIYNSATSFNYRGGHIARIITTALAQGKPKILNGLLHHRNGPYGWPTWKQIRGYEHPVVRAMRMNNTVSLEVNNPKSIYTDYGVHRSDYGPEGPEGPSFNFLWPGANPKDDRLFYHTCFPCEISATMGPFAVGATSSHWPLLRNFYEPPVTSRHKPMEFFYAQAVTRATIMNEVEFFIGDECNSALRLASTDPTTGSASNFKRTKQKRYRLIQALRSDAEGTKYTETIYPRAINTYRPFKLQKSDYAEVPGLGPNGYDRVLNRSFWRTLQSGSSIYINHVSDSRMRSEMIALNSTGTPQSTYVRPPVVHGVDSADWDLNHLNNGDIFARSILDIITGSTAARPGSPAGTTWGAGGAKNNWYHTASYVGYGVVRNKTSSIGYENRDAFQPYPISLLSMWPLDPREDIYNRPSYLTGSHGGRGYMIGLTPHRRSPSNLSLLVDGTEVYSSSSYAIAHTASALTNITETGTVLTGTAGELVYSTKPTIFYFDVHNNMHGPAGSDDHFASGSYTGYPSPTASLQFLRHTYPYNSPFYATNKIVAGTAPVPDVEASSSCFPMYDSYSDYIGDLSKYLARDYSIIPEFRISEHYDFYYDNFYDGLDLTAKVFVKKNANKFVRNLDHGMGSMPKSGLKTKHKLNFLTLHGASITSSSPLGAISGLAIPPTTKYEYDDTLGPIEVELDDPHHTYANEQDSAEFFAKYSHTENLTKFIHSTNKNYITPKRIRFNAKAIKKFLPYSGFYPVLRTVQLGAHLSSAFGPFLTSPTDSANENYPWISPHKTGGRLVPKAWKDKKTVPLPIVDQFGQGSDPATLQAFLEPLMAPGLLYNSIKSGIAVDYPIYGTKPLYHAHSDYKGYMFTSSFGVGGGYGLGASKAIPTILTSRETKRYPFEALYKLDKLTEFARPPGSRAPGVVMTRNYLVSDFVDIVRAEPAFEAGHTNWENNLPTSRPTSPSPTAGGGNTWIPSTSGTYFPNAIVAKTETPTKEMHLYRSSMNNFLAETMNFFLADQDKIKGLKFPVILSKMKEEDKKLAADLNKSYFLGVSLEMGLQQVMCEGPRHSSCEVFHDVTGLPNSAVNVDHFYMRGYLYGPAMEIAPFVGKHTTEYESVSIAGADGTATYPGVKYRTIGASMGGLEFRDYLTTNLQDPAYQAFTPPYFYGKSQLIMKYEARPGPTTAFDEEGERPSEDTITDLAKCMQTSSMYYEEYLAHRDGMYATDGALTPILPATASISSGSASRMKIEASIDIFNPPLKVSAGPEEARKDYLSYYIMPKWICPVLDFSSSYSYRESREQRLDFDGNPINEYKVKDTVLHNPYHDTTTGKSLWGGYGSDPYDMLARNYAYDKEGMLNDGIPGNTGGHLKGIYLKVEEALSEISEDTPENIGYIASTTANSDFGYHITRESQVATANPGTLSEDDLDIFAKQEYKIGQFADSKTVQEAIVVIPYFDEEVGLEWGSGIDDQFITVDHNEELEGTYKYIYEVSPDEIRAALANAGGDPGGDGGAAAWKVIEETGDLFTDLINTAISALDSSTTVTKSPEISLEAMRELSSGPPELFRTREIIPGKHFLPINKTVFTNILSVHLANKYDCYQPLNISGNNPAGRQITTNSDCGRMIDLLLGNPSAARAGFQLPPEFDFIHNSSIDPFQMMVIPISHTFKKQDLIDIYQGIMPESALGARKSTNNIFNCTPTQAFPATGPNNIDPGIFPWVITHGSEAGDTNVETSWYSSIEEYHEHKAESKYDTSPSTTYDANVWTLQRAIPLQQYDLANFLSAKYYFALRDGVSWSSRAIANNVNPNTENWSYETFYRKLKFMVFKVKQRGIYDFDQYRKSQRALKAKSELIDNNGLSDAQYDNWRVDTKIASELFGQNWPYDYFSLVELAKIDIEVEY